MFLYSFDYFDRVIVLDTIGIEKSMMDKISDRLIICVSRVL